MKKNMKENPKVQALMKPPETELEQKKDIYGQLQSLAELDMELNEARQRLNVRSRQNDIRHVEHLEELAGTILEALTTVEAKVALKGQIQKMLTEGNFKSLVSLMTAFGITMDKRETLLGQSDPERQPAGKKRLKLNVIWEGQDGTKTGVQAEVTE